MKYKTLGRTGMSVSTVSFGAWAIGGTWGPVDDEASMAALHAADLLSIDPAIMDAVARLYDERIRAGVHDNW